MSFGPAGLECSQVLVVAPQFSALQSRVPHQRSRGDFVVAVHQGTARLLRTFELDFRTLIVDELPPCDYPENGEDRPLH